MNQHRTVPFTEDVRPNFDDVVRRHSYDMPVECRVMEDAQRKSVPHGWHAERVHVCHDVSGLEELVSSKAADRAVMLVGADDPLAELALV